MGIDNVVTPWWPCWWLAAAALALVHGQGSLERPLCPEGTRCQQGERSTSEYFYKVNGHSYMVTFVEGKYYKHTCEAAALDDPALPRFPRLMRFANVTLVGCAPPVGASYAAALRTLNVTLGANAPSELKVQSLPVGAHVPRAALADLPPSLSALWLTASFRAAVLAADLGALEGLRSLTLDGVRAERLPAHLDTLRLRKTGITEVPPEALDVVTLEITEPRLGVFAGATPRLQSLTLSAPVRELPEAPLLRMLWVSGSSARSLRPLVSCGALQELTLTHAAVSRLPGALVAACGALRSLELRALRETLELPPELLRNATQLRRFKAAEFNISALPADLFDYSPNLEEIDLSNNNLRSLPRGLFSGVAESLQQLTLSGNALSARAEDGLEAVLAPLTNLRKLNLSKNPLGDLCPAGNSQFVTRRESILSHMTLLEQLVLSRTRQSVVCADWTRALQRLRRLDLTHNAVSALACRDLYVQRAPGPQPADLDLSGNPLARVACDKAAYDDAGLYSIPAQTANLVTDARLECDCGAYWLARMLRAGRVGVRYAPRCGSGPLRGRLLAEVKLDALTCTLRTDECAPNCTCSVVPDVDGVRAQCAASAAGGLPLRALRERVPRELRLRELSARRVGLSALPDALPDDLQLLDVSDNGIASSSAPAARALVGGGRRVRVAGNPLDCACGNLPLLDALVTHQAQVIDFERTLCADGRPLPAARASLSCGATDAGDAGGRGWGAGAGVLGALLASGAALALVAWLGRAEWRLRLKALLHAWGLRQPGRPEPGRPFDLFVAHADADDRFVAEHLVPRLEPGRRLCLAYRDWPVGAWIPRQIDASVRRSRRTLAVISRGFLAGAAGGAVSAGASVAGSGPGEAQWARAMVRAAHADALRESTPRLVLLLVEVSARELDAELRAMLDTHPHVRWGTPGAWDRLLYALPEPTPVAPVAPIVPGVPAVAIAPSVAA